MTKTIVAVRLDLATLEFGVREVPVPVPGRGSPETNRWVWRAKPIAGDTAVDWLGAAAMGDDLDGVARW